MTAKHEKREDGTDDDYRMTAAWARDLGDSGDCRMTEDGESSFKFFCLFFLVAGFISEIRDGVGDAIRSRGPALVLLFSLVLVAGSRTVSRHQRHLESAPGDPSPRASTAA